LYYCYYYTRPIQNNPDLKLLGRRLRIMREITLEELLEAGCHFGHQVTRGNPKARDYIFEARDNIHIVDLTKTKAGLEEAGKFIFNLSQKNGSLIVVGTKRQARSVVEEEVKKAKQQSSGKIENQIFYVTERWVGGTLTNFSEVAKNFKKLKDLAEKLRSEEERSKYTKKEIGLWEKERQKLALLYGGIADLKKIPDAVFVIDSHLEDLVIDEARKMGVTTVAIVDTNANPEIIDYPIPANDDATGSIKLITSYIIDAWIEGRNKIKNEKEPIRQAQGEKLKNKEEKKEIKSKSSAVSKVKDRRPKTKVNPSASLRARSKK